MTDLDMLSPIHTPQRVRRLVRGQWVGEAGVVTRGAVCSFSLSAPDLWGPHHLADPVVCPLDRVQLRDIIRTEFCGH